jgi:hypothetical protein
MFFLFISMDFGMALSFFLSFRGYSVFL